MNLLQFKILKPKTCQFPIFHPCDFDTAIYFKIAILFYFVNLKIKKFFLSVNLDFQICSRCYHNNKKILKLLNEDYTENIPSTSVAEWTGLVTCFLKNILKRLIY